MGGREGMLMEVWQSGGYEVGLSLSGLPVLAKLDGPGMGT